MALLQEILLKLTGILLESGPYVMLGFLIAGLLHGVFPASLFGRVFGRVGVLPLLRAIGLGSLIPICSCGVVPIGIGAYRGGAGVGTILAFMTAAPTLSPAAVLLSVKLLGWELTLWQILFVAGGSFLLGLCGNRWLQGQRTSASTHVHSHASAHAHHDCCGAEVRIPVESVGATIPAQTGTRLELPVLQTAEHREVHAPPEPLQELSCCGGDHTHTHSHAPNEGETSGHAGQRPGLLRQTFGVIRWVFWDFGPSVSLDMLIGLIFAATVLTLVPADWIVLLTGSRTVWSLLLVILVALPVYTCSMAAIPVVFSFLVAGMSPGAAVAFIIAGPATNFGEMNALRAQIGWRTALYYFVSLVTIAVGAGFLLDHLIHPGLPASITAATHQHTHGAHSTPSWLAWLSLLALVSMMLIETLRRCKQLRLLNWLTSSSGSSRSVHQDAPYQAP